VISAGLSDDTIKPPAQRVVHCYQEDPAWPREIFKNYFAHIWHITQIQGDKTYDKADEEYVFSCRLEDLVRFVQIMYLSKLSEVTTYCFAIQDRAVVKRSADATLAVDPEGELYHCPLDNNSKTYIDNVSTRLPFRLDIYQIWATYIARRDFPNMGAAQEYLQTHRCEALQVNTQEFFKFYTDHAKTYAQRTWDNGIIGVYWSFNKDGMHIRLYDLTKEQPEKIGDYMEGRHSEGIITSVEYTPGHEPIFHIKA
jgi:hypothetical protein